MRISTLGSGTGERMADAQVLLQVRPARARPQTMAGLAWWRFARHRMAVVGLLVVVVLGAASALAPWVSPYDPDKPHLQLQLGAPSLVHPMGTDDLGRASFLSLKEQVFVEAAKALGAGHGRIMVRHILPNAASPIIVAATLRVANSIITESGLSFLGFGVQPPTPTWGNMLRNAQDQMITAPWTAIFPGLFIFVTVIAINYVGDGLRDALDRRHVR